MKGVILSAGKGLRLYPVSRNIPKPLFAIYDKPLIYYSIYNMIKLGINEIMIIISPDTEELFKKLLGNGNHWGIKIEYAVQKEALGIAHALIIAEHFVKNDNICLILGDNIFYGTDMKKIFKKGSSFDYGSMIVGMHVDDPRAFGVLELDENDNILGIEEKPKKPKSNYIIPGLYFFDSKAIAFAKDLEPSARGEFEITDLVKKYLDINELDLIIIKDVKWFDAGTFKDLLKASTFIKDEQEKTNTILFSPELAALEKEYINTHNLEYLVSDLSKTDYGKYLKKVLNEIKE